MLQMYTNNQIFFMILIRKMHFKYKYILNATLDGRELTTFGCNSSLGLKFCH